MLIPPLFQIKTYQMGNIVISSPQWSHLNLGYHIKPNIARLYDELENAIVDLLPLHR